MLYERWRQVVREHPSQLALWDAGLDRRWTFEQLLQEAEQRPASAQPICMAATSGSEFILSVLCAWRDGQVLVPLEPGQAWPEIQPPLPENIVHLKTTSATTGVPRMIAFTAAQLVADCHNIITTMGLDPSIPNVGAISLAHSYGFSNLVLPLLLGGVPLMLAGSALPEAIRGIIESLPAVALPGVPALWRTWHEADIVSERIRIAISAGAPLPIELECSVFGSAGVKIHNFYGSSECGGIAYDASPKPRDEASLAGKPMSNVEVFIAEDGCVTVRSQAVGSAYWPNAEPELRDGVFKSGDLGKVNEEGVFLRGRASDRINVAGRKVSPEEIERALSAHPAVRECLVFSAPSKDARNEVIVGCVVLRTPQTGRELGEYLQKRLPAWQVPREWWFVETLEPNERGKRSRVEWRKRYLERNVR